MLNKTLAAACFMITAASASTNDWTGSFMVNTAKGKPFGVMRTSDGIGKIKVDQSAEPGMKPSILLDRAKVLTGQSDKVEVGMDLTPRSFVKALEDAGTVYELPAVSSWQQMRDRLDSPPLVVEEEGLQLQSDLFLQKLMAFSDKNPVTSTVTAMVYHESIRQEENGEAQTYDVTLETNWLQTLKRDFPWLETGKIETWYRSQKGGTIAGLHDFALLQYVSLAQRNPHSALFQTLPSDQAEALERTIRARTHLPQDVLDTTSFLLDTRTVLVHQ